jgi:hypothetical protein
VLGLLALERNPAAVIYGVITVGAVLAAEGARTEPFVRSVGTAIAILLLYWLVHSWSVDTGDRVERGRHFTWAKFNEALRDEAPIMRGALLPVMAVILAGVLGATDRRAVLVGTLVSAALLVVIEFSVAVRDRMSNRQVAIQTAAGAAFGMALIGLRFLVI